MMAWSDIHVLYIHWRADSLSRNCIFQSIWQKVFRHPSFVFRIMQNVCGLFWTSWSVCSEKYYMHKIRMSVCYFVSLLLAITWLWKLKKDALPPKCDIRSFSCGTRLRADRACQAGRQSSCFYGIPGEQMSPDVTRCDQMWTDVTMHRGSLWLFVLPCGSA